MSEPKETSSDRYSYADWPKLIRPTGRDSHQEGPFQDEYDESKGDQAISTDMSNMSSSPTDPSSPSATYDPSSPQKIITASPNISTRNLEYEDESGKRSLSVFWANAVPFDTLDAWHKQVEGDLVRQLELEVDSVGSEGTESAVFIYKSENPVSDLSGLAGCENVIGFSRDVWDRKILYFAPSAQKITPIETDLSQESSPDVSPTSRRKGPKIRSPSLSNITKGFHRRLSSILSGGISEIPTNPNTAKGSTEAGASGWLPRSSKTA